MIDQHHLLECILWPNGDGTFRKIINTAKRLDELGIYKDFKLTIPIEHRAHSIMHKEFKEGTEYEMKGEKAPMFGRTGEKNPMFGRTGEKAPMYGRTGEKAPMYGKGYLLEGSKNPMYGRTGDKNPMYGRTGDKHGRWKGDKAGPSAMYRRANKLYKSGQITEEEFQPFRDARNEYRREKRANRI